MSDSKRIRENTLGESSHFEVVDDSYVGEEDSGGHGIGNGASNQSRKGTARREQVRRACVRCASSKRKCTGVFPCDRCIRLGNGDSCVEVQLKRRGMSTASDNFVPRLPTSGLDTSQVLRAETFENGASSRKRRLPEAAGGSSSSNNAWSVMAMNVPLIDGSVSSYGLQPGAPLQQGLPYDPVLTTNGPGVLPVGFGANSLGSLSIPVSTSLVYPSPIPLIPQPPFPQHVAFDVGQLPPPPRDLEVSVDSTQWSMNGVLGNDLSPQITSLRDSRLSSLGISTIPSAAPGILNVAQTKSPREMSTEDVLDLQNLNLAPSARISGSRQASRDSPQKDLWSPDVEESKSKNVFSRAEVSGYSGHRISEEFDGLKLPDLRRESSSSSRISLVSSPVAPLIAEGAQSVVMIRSTGAVMVISRDEPMMYVSEYAKPFSIIKPSTLKIDAADSPDKLLPFPCIRFGFQDLGAPLFGRADSGIQALGFPSICSANTEARRLLNLGDDPELKNVLILARLAVEAPLWVMQSVAPLRAEIIRHTVFHRGTYCEVVGQYSRRFFKEASMIFDTSNFSMPSPKDEAVKAPFSCHERIILAYYPSGCLRSLMSVFTAVVDM